MSVPKSFTPTLDEKLDLLVLHKADYAASQKPVLLDIQPALYLGIEGEGAPGGSIFETRIGALYAMAFMIKMTRKAQGRGDYSVSKLECLYLNTGNSSLPPPALWRWKMLIRTPDFITTKDLSAALTVLKKRGKQGDSEKVLLERIHEGPCVQMLHVGPYDKETETLEKMISFGKSKGLDPSGPHHEIYISDPRRIEPARLKTILRFPVSRSCP